MKKEKDEIEIDLLKLAKDLLHRAWAIILAAVICAAGAFSYSHFKITPMYQSTALMYVNNSTLSLSNGFSISPGELAAAQSLVETYKVILTSRNTLNEVIRRANLSYTYEQLCSMISASSVNETEVFNVNVVGADPEETELIANTIAEVLPEKIADIVDGSSVRIVDYAIVPSHSISPNVTKNTAMGLLLGAFAAAAVIVVISLMDTTIESEEYLIQNYKMPVLSVIPEFSSAKKSRYGYYKKSKESSK